MRLHEKIMRIMSKRPVALCAFALGPLVLGVFRLANAEMLAEQTVQLSVHHVQGVRLEQVPALTQAEIERHKEVMEAMEEAREQAYKPIPVDPAAVYPTTPMNPPTEVHMEPSKTSVAPGDFTFFRNSAPGYSSYAAQWWDPNEPTAAANGRVCLYTGNIYGRISGDHGATFSALNIDGIFPTAAGGAGGDYVTYYERTRGLMVWYLQYARDGAGNNVQRIAVANGQRSLENNSWTFWDVSPATFGFGTNRWMDYPDVAVSSNMLYVTSNVFNGTTIVGEVVYRVSLDQLAAGGTINVGYVTPALNNYRLTTGAGTTMYFASQVDNNTLRIYTWPDAGSATSVDRDVTAWQTGTSNAQSPDGRNWLANDGKRIVAAWLAGNRVGLMWDSAEGGAYTQANVRYARFDPSNWNLTDEGAIWNPNHAWGYPSAHPNDSGAIGGIIHLGGRTGVGSQPFPNPCAAAWMADAFNSYTVAPMEAVIFASGTNGPASNRWGDYCSTRMHSPYSLTWVGAGYIQNGGTASSQFEPHYVWFGRQGDTPPASNTIYVNKFATTWQNGDGAHPYHTINAGAYAPVPGDRVVISAGTYNELLTLNRACTITTEGGPVYIQP